MANGVIPTPRRGASYAIAIGTMVVAFVIQVPLRMRIDRANESASQTATPRGASEARVISGWKLRDLSLGFDGLLADLYWTRAVQYYGRSLLSKHPSYPQLGKLLRTATDLDPHLLIAYRFGSIFLAARPPAGAGEPQQAMQLIQRGIVANPDYWRLWEDWGFIEYWDLHNYPAASRIFLAGSKRPGAEIWLKTLAASVAAKGGEVETSRLLWMEVYKTAANAQIRRSALEHLRKLDEERMGHTQ
jgi:hypothetical protein